MWTPDESVIITKEKKAEIEAAEAISSVRVISARQFWLAALEVGITKSSLISEINSSYEGSEAEYLRIEVKEASSFHRDNALVSELSEMAGIEPYQLDELWLRAAKI